MSCVFVLGGRNNHRLSRNIKASEKHAGQQQGEDEQKVPSPQPVLTLLRVLFIVIWCLECTFHVGTVTESSKRIHTMNINVYSPNLDS